MLFSLQSNHFEPLTGQQNSTLLAVVDFLTFLFAKDRKLSFFGRMILAFEMVKGGDIAEGGVVLLALESTIEDGSREMGFGLPISLYGFSSLNHC